MCPNCEEWKETVEHFLEQCPAKALLRGNIFYNHYMTSRDIFKRYSLYYHQVHQAHQPLQRPGLPGPIGGYLMLPVLRSASSTGYPFSLQLTSGRSLLDSSLLLGTMGRQSFFVVNSSGPSGVQPLFRLKKQKLHNLNTHSPWQMASFVIENVSYLSIWLWRNNTTCSEKWPLVKTSGEFADLMKD